jgi:hypothetical protein
MTKVSAPVLAGGQPADVALKRSFASLAAAGICS